MPKAMTRWRCARRILACAVMMTIVLAPARQSNAQQDDAPAATSQDVAQIIRSAKTQLRDGEASAALFLFDEALRARPTSDTALSGRIESLIALGKWAPALEALNARVARAPTDPGRLLDRAFVRLSIASLETDLSHLSDAAADLASADAAIVAAAAPDAAFAGRLALGNALLARLNGDESAAEGFLIEAIASDPRPAGADRAMGDLRYSQARHPDALASYDAALAAAPMDGVSLLRRAFTREKLGDRQGARIDTDDAGALLLRSPSADQPDLWTALGDLRRRLDDVSGALTAYRRTLAAAPAHAAAQYGAARALISLGRASEALGLLDQLLDRNGGERRIVAEAQFQRGRALLMLGEGAAAKAAFDRSLAVRPNDPTALYNRALAKISLQDSASARQDLSTAVDLAPRNAAIGYAHARTLLAAGQRQAGLDALLAVETSGARTLSLNLPRALALEAVGRPDRAIAGYAAARGAKARQGEVRSLLSIGAVEAAALRAAELTLQEPDDVEALLLEARAQVSAGRPEAALVILETAQALGGSDTKIALAKAQAHLSVTPRSTQRLDRAARELDRAVLRGHERVQALRLRSVVYQQQGQLNAAKRDLDLAVEAQPDDPTLRFERAQLLAQMDQCVEAIRDLDVSLLLTPSNGDALKARGRCKLAEGSLLDGLGDMISAQFY